jgi:hypothetical protein
VRRRVVVEVELDYQAFEACDPWHAAKPRSVWGWYSWAIFVVTPLIPPAPRVHTA